MSQTSLETIVCDLCGSARYRPWLRARDQIYGMPGQFSLVRCESCGTLYINPRPDRSSIGAFYPDLDYHAFQPSGGIKSRLLARRRRSEARALLAGLPGGAAALEIGCGIGELLCALREAGAQVTGVEPNAAAVRVARDQFGLDVHTGMLDAVLGQLRPAGFDLILMKYALEHVHSPRETLTAIAGLLKPGGRAVFWVPNAQSWDARLFGRSWRGLDAPRHLFIFTPETMCRFAELAGLRVTRIDYSAVPNDWAGSIGFWLQNQGVARRIADRFGVDNMLLMGALAPISTAAATFHRAGRMRVTVAPKA